MENNSPSNSPVLVVGATGNLGMEICRQLRAANKKVKGLVRSSSNPERLKALEEMGVDLVTADLKDPSSVQNAVEGVSTVISGATSVASQQPGDSIESVDRDGQLNVVAAADAAGVKQFVFISFPPMQPDFPLQTAKRIVEDALRDKSFSYTVLQPTYFMEIWLGPHLGFDYTGNKAVIYGEGKNKISFIAIQDVAAFAAASVDHPAAKNAIIELGGPDDLSVREVVSIFEEESGQSYTLQTVPREALQQQMEAADNSLAKSFAALMIALNEAAAIDMKQPVQTFGVTLTSVRDYAKRTLAKQVEPA